MWGGRLAPVREGAVDRDHVLCADAVPAQRNPGVVGERDVLGHAEGARGGDHVVDPGGDTEWHEHGVDGLRGCLDQVGIAEVAVFLVVVNDVGSSAVGGVSGNLQHVRGLIGRVQARAVRQGGRQRDRLERRPGRHLRL